MADCRRGGGGGWYPWLASSWLVAVLAAAAAAHGYKAGQIEIRHPWARPTVSVQRNGAAYLQLRNLGDAPDRLLGARTPEADRVELHGSTVDAEGVARMRERDGVEVPAGGEAELAPGGLHLMLVDLKGRLFEGTSFPMTLVFERAGEVPVEVMVEGNGGTGGAGHDTGHGAH